MNDDKAIKTIFKIIGTATSIALILVGSANRAWSQTTSYHIGNSLTWDSQPLGIASLAEQRGHDHRVGYHISCNRNLNDIWTRPENVCLNPVAEFGLYTEALPNHQLDAVTLQPWRGGDITLAEDTARILDFIDLAQSNPENADTKFFIYSGWPSQFQLDNMWTADVEDADETQSTTSREYFELLTGRVRDRTEADVFYIPVGEVLFQLSQKIESGELPGFTSPSQLYRDNAHASYSVGRYVAGVTTYATLFGEDPSGLTAGGSYGASDPVYTPELYDVIHETVWQAVQERSLRLAGDYNGNGRVEQADLDLVLLNWGEAADSVPDEWRFHLPSGEVDQAELDQVLLNWGQPRPALSAHAVPEPRTWMLMACLAILAPLMIRRRHGHR